jgi:hypothetical protein
LQDQAFVSGGTAYVWIKRSKTGTPVTELRVIREAPRKNERDVVYINSPLNPGVSPCTYLGFKQEKSSTVIVDIMLQEGNAALPSGFKRVSGDVYQTGHSKAHLAIKTQEISSSKSSPPVQPLSTEEWRVNTLKIGDALDVQDPSFQWCMAEVIGISEGRIQVHYTGWPRDKDEWIEIKSGRLAPYKTHLITQLPHS